MPLHFFAAASPMVSADPRVGSARFAASLAPPWAGVRRENAIGLEGCPGGCMVQAPCRSPWRETYHHRVSFWLWFELGVWL